MAGSWSDSLSGQAATQISHAAIYQVVGLFRSKIQQTRDLRHRVADQMQGHREAPVVHDSPEAISNRIADAPRGSLTFRIRLRLDGNLGGTVLDQGDLPAAVAASDFIDHRGVGHPPQVRRTDGAILLTWGLRFHQLDDCSLDEALGLGLVHRVVAAEQLDDEVGKLAQKLRNGPPIALAFTKRAIRRSLDLDRDAEFDYEVFAQVNCIQTEDHQEGVRAFFDEKRAPVFNGR